MVIITSCLYIVPVYVLSLFTVSGLFQLNLSSLSLSFVFYTWLLIFVLLMVSPYGSVTFVLLLTLCQLIVCCVFCL